MPLLSSKLPDVGVTIFTVMSQMAQQYQALNLSQGFPNFEASPELTTLVAHFVQKGFNQYAPMAGIMPLREVLAEKTSQLYQAHYHPESEITIVSGATEALFVALMAVVRPGDEVLLIEPCYDSYAPAIRLCGGIPVYVTTLAENDFRIDWQEVKQKITPQTRAILLNTPHNPTGRCLTSADLAALAELVAGTDLWLISDEVYEHILFDGRQHHSLCTRADLRERTFLCGSFGKTFHVTGWKVGYCLAPRELTTEFRKIHQWVTFSTVTPIQYALAEFLKTPDHYLSLPAFYQQKRDTFVGALAGSRWEWIPAEGSFFQLLSYKNISEAHDYDLAVELTQSLGVASIPISVFYHQKISQQILRFCFAKDDHTLLTAAERLATL
jgi:methionine transaminase